MLRRKMQLPEQHNNYSVRMKLANLANLGSSMAIAGSDLPQVVARHAIQPVNSLTMIAGRAQQFVERRPIVSPVQIEANALAQFDVINFTAPPFFENVLIAGKDGFHSQHNRPVACESALLNELRRAPLCRRQRMIVPHQNYVGGAQRGLNLLPIENRFVILKRLAELAQVFAAAV